jgi:hypothetical protein
MLFSGEFPSRCETFMLEAALPIAVLVGLHFIKAGVLADKPGVAALPRLVPAIEHVQPFVVPECGLHGSFHNVLSTKLLRAAGCRKILEIVARTGTSKMFWFVLLAVVTLKLHGHMTDFEFALE